MGYLPPKTISETLRQIQKGDLILPAIQREYVWKPSQVVGLFDSVMRWYPIGGFLSWRVDPETVQKFRFYGFLKDYNEFNHRHNPTLDLVPGQAATAILDGQQRLTSLNVGLRGSYAHRVHGGWRNNPDAYPKRKLYLNVLGEAETNEAGLRYDFRFLTERQLEGFASDESKHFFEVAKIFEAERMQQLWVMAAQAELANSETASSILSRLWESLHATQNIHFYEETDQDVERVLDIFIRVNSAGTVLSYSDLLLSIATAQWKEREAREAVHKLVDSLNSAGQGFRFSQDVVLKSGLVLAGISDIAFRVKNFTAENMATLDREWDAISESLKISAGLLSDFGLSDATLTADSVLIPVAYYVHARGLTQSYRSSASEAVDRETLRSWTLRSLVIPGIWGSGLDTLLRDLRDVIDDHGKDSFPGLELERRMAARGKSLAVSDDLVDDLLTLRYGARRTFAVLALLFSHVDTRNVHHVDHIFPSALLMRSKLKQAGLDPQVVDEIESCRDALPNLQLLEGPQNIAKSAKIPAVWASEVFPTDVQLGGYLERNSLPSLPASVEEFLEFFAARRIALAAVIRVALGGPAVENPTIDSARPLSVDEQLNEETLGD